MRVASIGGKTWPAGVCCGSHCLALLSELCASSNNIETCSQGAVIYVAGSATKLAQSVLTALEKVVADAAPMSQTESQKYVRQLEAGRRYFVEAW